MRVKSQPHPFSSLPYLPSFYNEENAGLWNYRPDLQRIFEESALWEKRYSIPLAQQDDKHVLMLIIDGQKDFCVREGALYVAGRSGMGAIADSGRTAEFIYLNLASISRIIPTFDTHLAYQIFFPSFWVDKLGNPVKPYTAITIQDIESGTYRVSPKAAAALNLDYAWLTRQAFHYCEQLAREGKYVLYIWPYHCMLGTDGHALVGVIEEACKFHAFVRGAALTPEMKGDVPLSENYSVLRSEVLTRHDGGVIARKNTRLIKTLKQADRLIVSGEALSHCVSSTIDDFLFEIMMDDPSLAKKVYILEDCMSSVVVRDQLGNIVQDYTQHSDAALKRFAAAGMHIVQSTTPISSWEDF